MCALCWGIVDSEEGLPKPRFMGVQICQRFGEDAKSTNAQELCKHFHKFVTQVMAVGNALQVGVG